MANDYCQLYGKRAVYRGFIRIERFKNRKLHNYTCEYPVSE